MTDAGKDSGGSKSDAGVKDGGPLDAGHPPSDGAVAQCQGTGANGYNQYKYAYFGDLHQHTSFSLDAYSFGTRTDPATAYWRVRDVDRPRVRPDGVFGLLRPCHPGAHVEVVALVVRYSQGGPSNWQTLVPGCEAGGPLDVSIQERAWTSPIWFEP